MEFNIQSARFYFRRNIGTVAKADVKFKKY